MTDHDTFLAWAKTKPADEAFEYMNNTNCAFAQFLRDTGVCADPIVGGTDWWPRGRMTTGSVDMDPRITRIDLDNAQRPLEQRTFGALVACMEKLADG